MSPDLGVLDQAVLDAATDYIHGDGEIEPKFDELALAVHRRDRALQPVRRTDVDVLCEVMHDAYEQAAAGLGWETQQASRKPWSDVPEANKATMRVAVAALLDHLGHPAVGPGAVRRTWTITTEERAIVEGETYIDITNNTLMRWMLRHPSTSPVSVIVSVEPQ